VTGPPHGREEGCPFCAIADGEDSSVEIVCEDPKWVAFLPPEPATPGHTLVVPKEHVADIWSLDSELGAVLMDAVVRVGTAVREALTPAGMNLISSSGEAAEQTVFHLHLHVVPRYLGDHIDPIWPPHEKPDNDLNASVANRIREACRA
jgi:diadenosine tetraphosphate (Ap4A) HIT family hydrolase